MRKFFMILTYCVVFAWIGAVAGATGDDMPIVTDQPYTEAELAEMEAEKVERLRQAQQILIDLGYLKGRADGLMGPRTQEALRTIQAEGGLAATGALDDATWSALLERQALAEKAMAAQRRLIDLNYLVGDADGIFGDRTLAGLRLFQYMQGLEVTGALDEATLSKLDDETLEALPAPIAKGDEGEDVAALQARLIRFGFMNGTADGIFGKDTAAAIKRFQSHLLAQGVDENLGIEPTGTATPVTRLCLMDPGYSSYIADLAPGDKGDEAARVERKLVQLGYMDAEADTVFDEYGARCAQAFQVNAGLEQGVFDAAFFDALFAEDPPAAEHFVLHDIAYGDRGVAVREVQGDLVTAGMTIQLPNGIYNEAMADAVERLHGYLKALNSPQARMFENKKLLNVGAQQALRDGLLDNVLDLNAGTDADLNRRIQRRLHTLYYIPKHGIDSKMGESTREALKAFQQANGLAATGSADAATLKVLFSGNAACKPYPYRVEVDIDNQRVYVFQRNESGAYEQIHTFICSTGLGSTTPPGIYLNGFPVNRWHYFERFDCWAQYSFEIEGNIMFHSVIYSSNDTDSLRENSVYALGSKASHGCIRLQVKDAKWLFEHCKRGSLAIVIY